MSDSIVFLQKRKDRAIATILSYKDNECGEFLPNDKSQGLRKVILDEINSFYDSALAFAEDMNDTVGLNSLYSEKLQELNQKMDDISARLS